MGLMAQCVDRIGVMYAGRLAELFSLWAGAKPARRAAASVHADVGRKPAIAGAQGCVSRHSRPAALVCWSRRRDVPFHPRCPQVMDCCSDRVPELEEVATERRAACHLHAEGLGQLSRVAQPRRLVNTPLLEARGASRAFGGGVFDRQQTVAVADASLVIPEDEPVVVAIAGESGSGEDYFGASAAGHPTADRRIGALPRHGIARSRR